MLINTKKLIVSVLLVVFGATLLVPLLSFIRPTGAAAAPANVLTPTNVEEHNTASAGQNNNVRLETPVYTNSGMKLVLKDSATGNSLGDFTYSNGTYVSTNDTDLNSLLGCDLDEASQGLEFHVLITAIVPTDATNQDSVDNAYTGTDYKKDAQDYVRKMASPYLVMQCRYSTTFYNNEEFVYNNGIRLWTHYMIADSASSISLDPGSAVGVPADSLNGVMWADYTGKLTLPTLVGIGSSRYRAISPYEIIDLNNKYPGGKYVTYAISEGSNWGGGGQQRLFNDGINLYWPLKESALGKKTYTFGDYDFKTAGGLCRGGFNIKSSDQDNGNLTYGRIYAVPTRTTSGICTIVKGSNTVGTDQAFGHVNKGSYPSGWDLSEEDWLITPSMYARALNMSSWYAHFYWVDTNTIGAYRKDTSVTLKKWPGNNGDQSAALSSMGVTGTNMEVWTSESCNQSTGLPKAALLIKRDTNKSLTDWDTNSSSATADVYRLIDGKLEPGWNDGQIECLIGEQVEDNAASFLKSWTDTIAGGGKYASVVDAGSRVSFISYPSRSVGNAAGGIGGLEGGQPIDGSGSVNDEPSCETSSFTLGWISCGIIEALAGVTNSVFTNIIEPYLKTTPISTSPSAENSIYKVWASMRTVANVLLVFALLAVVFAQSVGGGLIDAYTAKKVMPRLLAAAILINISIYIVAVLVDIFNVIGAGIGNLLVGPFKNTIFSKFESPGGGTERVIGIGLIIAAAVTTILGVISFRVFKAGGAGNVQALGSTVWPFIHFILIFVLLPAALITLAIFATLIIRQGLILLLVVVAPVAFAMFAIPSTEKYFKKWWETLTTTLMVYPIITVLFSLSAIFAALAYNSPGEAAAFSGFIGAITAFIILIIPMLAIPFAFKLAGGILGNVLNTSRGALNRIGSHPQNRYKEQKAMERKAMFDDGWQSGNSKFRRRVVTRQSGRVQLAGNIQNRGNSGRIRGAVARRINGGRNPTSQDALMAGAAAEQAAANAGADAQMQREARVRSILAYNQAVQAGLAPDAASASARATGAATTSGADRRTAAHAGATAGRSYARVIAIPGSDSTLATVAADASGAAVTQGHSIEAASTAGVTAARDFNDRGRTPQAHLVAMATSEAAAVAHDRLVRSNGGNHTQASADAQDLTLNQVRPEVERIAASTRDFEAAHTGGLAVAEAHLDGSPATASAAGDAAAAEHIAHYTANRSHIDARNSGRREGRRHR